MKDFLVVVGVVLRVDDPVYLPKRRVELCQNPPQDVVEDLVVAVLYRFGKHADHKPKFLDTRHSTHLRLQTR